MFPFFILECFWYILIYVNTINKWIIKKDHKYILNNYILKNMEEEFLTRIEKYILFEENNWMKTDLETQLFKVNYW